MEIILLKDVEKLGTRGQVVKVADGYGRNYLLPQKIAVVANAQSKKWVDQQRVRFLKEEAKEKADAEQLAQLMQGVTLTFTRKAGEQGTLFGSVTSMDVAEGLAAQGYKIERRKIQLDTPLKTLGDHEVPVRLHREVTTNIKVKVQNQPGSEPAVQTEPPPEPAAK